MHGIVSQFQRSLHIIVIDTARLLVLMKTNFRFDSRQIRNGDWARVLSSRVLLGKSRRFLGFHLASWMWQVGREFNDKTTRPRIMSNAIMRLAEVTERGGA